MNIKLLRALALCPLLILVGCQTPAVHVADSIINLGTDIHPDMRHTNIAAVVAFDEVWAGNYRWAVRNQQYVQGVVAGTPEYGLRVVQIYMRTPEWGAGWHAGEKLWPTSVIIPDHLPPLRANDYVEIRQTTSTRTVENFVRKKEGNIVIRVLCPRAAADWQQCAERLPRMGKYAGFGQTGTYYPESIAEYGFTYTPRYDKDGNLLGPQ